MIHVKDGHLIATASDEISLRKMMRYFKVDLEELEKRLSRPTAEWLAKKGKKPD